MYVSFDDTDSNEGLCTTYVATEIIRDTDLDIIGYPRLVRLNPAVPWKTRGNGSLSLRLGTGVGIKKQIGEIDGDKIYCYEEQTSKEPDANELLNKIIPIIKKNRKDSSDTGIVISKTKPSPSFYWKGVRSIVEKDDIVKELDRINAIYHEFGNGRGIIGSTCGMAWRPKDSTYELITYRPKDRWGTKRIFEPDSIGRMNSAFPSTFNSWEDRFNKVSMVPGTPCPVMYGLRGECPEDLSKASEMICSETLERKMIFLTNQGTDDHIIHDFHELVPMSSYYIEGSVIFKKHLSGGHFVLGLETKYGIIDCTIYEPAKEFRTTIGWLVPGDLIGVMGELRTEPRTINIEKIKVIGTVKEFEKISNPICVSCERTMESIGKEKGYRCRRCGTSSEYPIIKENIRWILPGWYEPPTSSRRHLSKPLKRMNEEQPVDFVNSRT